MTDSDSVVAERKRAPGPPADPFAAAAQVVDDGYATDCIIPGVVCMARAPGS